MLQTREDLAGREPSLLDGMITIEPTPRIGKLKDAFLNRTPVVTIERARIETRILKETAGEPMITRRAKAFAAIVREMPIHIEPHQLLVGDVDSGPFPTYVNPSNAGIFAMRPSAGEDGSGSSRLTDEA